MSEGDLRTAPHVAGTDRPLVVSLNDEVAGDSSLTGGKAAALARGSTAGLDSLPGLVLTTAFSQVVDGGAAVATHPAVAEAYQRAGGDDTALVARSSSVVEDMATSSMAGQFESVIGIRGFDAFVDAVSAVLDSRARAGAAEHPIAVLVQPLIEPRYGGVLFGVDPVTGRTDRRIVSAVAGGPERLVSGEVDGSRYVLDAATGKVLDFAANDGPSLGAVELRRLSDLSAKVATVYGGPQDVEWAIDDDGPCGCCSRARSRPRSPVSRAGRSTGRARSPRRSRSPSPSSSAICGCRRSVTPCAKR